MGCGLVAPGHWVGVSVLLLGLLLSVVGVTSPWWRIVDDPDFTRHEGLWQLCIRRRNERFHCHVNEESSGLWRSVQVVKLMALLLLAAGCCSSGIFSLRLMKRICRRCLLCSLASLAAGLTSLVADLLYVGHMELHADHLPGEYVYAWSFAVSVAGSSSSLLSALIFFLSDRYCSPKFTSHLMKPYWPYRQCAVSFDPNGHPQYSPYPWSSYPYQVKPGWTEEPQLSRDITAMENRRQLEKNRNGHVWFAGEEKYDHSRLRTKEAGLDGSHQNIRNYSPDFRSGGLNNNSSSSTVENHEKDQDNDVRQSRRSQQSGVAHGQGRTTRNEQCSEFFPKRLDSSSPVTIRNVNELSAQPKRYLRNESDQPIFTIEKVVKQPARETAREAWREGDLPEMEPVHGERLVWNRSSTPSHSVYLSQPGSRHAGPHANFLPWSRKPKVMIKTRRGRFEQ